MSPTKHAGTKKKGPKRARTESDHFKSAEADMKYNDCYKRATIVMERVVQLEELENTCILDAFKERTWTKLLNPIGTVYSEIIREFFSNAAVEEDKIVCWVRHKEFEITRDSIQDFLEIRPHSQPMTVQYDERLGHITEMITALGGVPKKSSMDTLKFSPEMRTLSYVMIHNLYPVTNLTTLSAPRTRFLYDLFTHKEIDICSHIFHILKKSITKQNSRTIMPFPSLIMGLIAKAKLKFPSGLTVVQRDYPIGANTLTRSTAHIKRPKTGPHLIPPPRGAPQDIPEEGGDTEEEIERFTSAPETAQPSSSAPAQPQGLSKLDQILAKMDLMSTVLDTHVQDRKSVV